jgi:hypothetical protein
MTKNLRAFIILLIILSVLACGLFDFENATKMAQAISPDPDAVYIDKFKTTYPDGKPGVGLIYESSGDVLSLVDYYKEELDRKGWKIDEVRNLDDPSVPVVIVSSHSRSTCIVTIENFKSSRKITIKVE